MQSSARLTVRTKLIGGFLIVAAVAAIIGLEGLNAVGQVDARAGQMFQAEVQGLRQIADARGSVIGAGGNLRTALRAADKQALDESVGFMKQRFASAYKSLEQANVYVT